MDEITYKIAEYAATASFDQLTDVSVHAATQRLVDSSAARLGLMIASRRKSAGDWQPVKSRASIRAALSVSATGCQPRRQPLSIRR